MKHLLYLLVIANLVYFSWHMLQGEEGDGARDELLQVPPDTRRLMTLQELQQQREKQESPAETDSPVDDRAEAPGEEVLAGIESLTTQQPPEAGIPLTCYSIGPFMSDREAEAAADILGKLELEAGRRSEEREVKIGYWVHLPEMSREKNLEYKAKLDKNRDKEYFIGRDNVMSLGAFKDKSRADRRMRQLRKIGIEAILEPRYRMREVTWLDLAVGLSETGHEQLVSELPESDIQPRVCR